MRTTSTAARPPPFLGCRAGDPLAGTGKTLVSTADGLQARLVLFVVPTFDLAAQTALEWRRDGNTETMVTVSSMDAGGRDALVTARLMLPADVPRLPSDAVSQPAVASRLCISVAVKLQPTRCGPLQLTPITSPSFAASGRTCSHQVSNGMDSTRGPFAQICAARCARAEVDQRKTSRAVHGEVSRASAVILDKPVHSALADVSEERCRL
ncbi:hypothetical protein G3I48_06370 [Streptomyces griseus]|uniref:hypothetical protein n=1 Tax=Streptomyces griseus TaxID=1911 RepID=UPI0013BC5A6F|nr:hypothetical protein [Streptomyces griseus]